MAEVKKFLIGNELKSAEFESCKGKFVKVPNTEQIVKVYNDPQEAERDILQEGKPLCAAYYD
jgi:hypothetical protein